MSKYTALRTALDRCITEGLTFVAFRVPGEVPEVWAQRTPEVETVDGSLMWELNEVFIVAPFLLDPERVPFIRADVELAFGEIDPDVDLLNGCQGSPHRSALTTSTTSRDEFMVNVEQAKAMMTAGHLRKVVLSRVLHAGAGMHHAIAAFTAALTDRPDAFVAMANTPEHGLWLGASPERLVHEQDDQVIVDALAGTMSAVEAPPDPHAWGAKERDEQQQVTDGVLHAFSALGLKSIRTQGPLVTKAHGVSHLHTLIEADLNARPLSDVVLALHPTPAVGGWPKDAAMGFIRRNERHARGLYTGFWGPWNPDGRTDLYVNIRCMHLWEEDGLLFVGAGITPGSDAAREWAETEEKAQVWLKLLAGLKD